MAEVRTPREAQSREAVRRRWKPSSTLPEVQAKPGYRYHWVRTHLMGEADAMNIGKNFREGYEPVKVTDHPELQLESNAKGEIVICGLMLCRMPEEMAQERDAFYTNQAASQAQAVATQFSNVSDPRMPVFSETKSESSRGSSFGSGSI